jgi:hypothetical protein
MHLENTGMKTRQRIDPGSLYIIRDEAQYEWKHKVDAIKDERFSITIRGHNDALHLALVLAIEEAPHLSLADLLEDRQNVARRKPGKER